MVHAPGRVCTAPPGHILPALAPARAALPEAALPEAALPD